jgi:hypothetical protein
MENTDVVHSGVLHIDMSRISKYRGKIKAELAENGPFSVPIYCIARFCFPRTFPLLLLQL